MHSGPFDAIEEAFFREGDQLAQRRAEDFSDLDRAPPRDLAAASRTPTLTNWPPPPRAFDPDPDPTLDVPPLPARIAARARATAHASADWLRATMLPWLRAKVLPWLRAHRVSAALVAAVLVIGLAARILTPPAPRAEPAPGLAIPVHLVPATLTAPASDPASTRVLTSPR